MNYFNYGKGQKFKKSLSSVYYYHFIEISMAINENFSIKTQYLIFSGTVYKKSSSVFIQHLGIICEFLEIQNGA